jgi:ubiquinone/menaquinone biosynthesis C-methylase UbiE
MTGPESNRKSSVTKKEEIYDLCHKKASFDHFSDQDSALEEIKRVLKPGGKI